MTRPRWIGLALVLAAAVAAMGQASIAPAFGYAPIINALTAYQVNGKLLCASAAPTISSGFGTSPSIVSSNGSCTFRVNVGTGGAATSGVVALGATAATGWNCLVIDTTNNTVTRQTADTTTTSTVTAAAAWAASDVLIYQCEAY